MYVQLSSCFFSCSGRRIPLSLNEPPIHVIGGALGCVGWTRVFVSRDWIFQSLVAEVIKPHFYICTYVYLCLYVYLGASSRVCLPLRCFAFRCFAGPRIYPHPPTPTQHRSPIHPQTPAAALAPRPNTRPTPTPRPTPRRTLCQWPFLAPAFLAACVSAAMMSVLQDSAKPGRYGYSPHDNYSTVNVMYEEVLFNIDSDREAFQKKVQQELAELVAQTAKWQNGHSCLPLIGR